MKTAKLKKGIELIDSGEHTYNGHFLDPKTTYHVLSESSKVAGFPIIIQDPVHKNINLVSDDALDLNSNGGSL